MLTESCDRFSSRICAACDQARRRIVANRRMVQASFYFQAEDGIREAQESRGLRDVYKRQTLDATFVRLIVILFPNPILQMHAEV
mgnify:CR=1 FL=1